MNEKEETRSKLETLKVLCQEIHQRYETELRAEKQKSETLCQQFETENKSDAERLSDNQEQIQRIRAERDQEKMELESELFQQDASKREKSFHGELEDLKIKLRKQTSTNIEEDFSQALHTEMPHLVDELKDEVCQQGRRSPFPLYRYGRHDSLNPHFNFTFNFKVTFQLNFRLKDFIFSTDSYANIRLLSPGL